MDKEIVDLIHKLPMDRAIETYAEILQSPKMASDLGKHDRFFLMWGILGRKDIAHPWLYARCREVEDNTDDHLDLWSRGHYKSSIVTYAGAIQEILKNPDISIGIFSHTRPIAKAFLKQIKREFEDNKVLKFLYPEVCYDEPHKQSPQWSEDGGIICKRNSNPKEATVEAWGLVDGQPTSKHYKLRIYDDVVTRESVTTPDQIEKTTSALSLSHNLGSKNGRVWYVGTRYHFGDTYQSMIDSGAVTMRIYPATDDGTINGNPVFLSTEEWEKLKLNSDDYTVACQQLQNPTSGTTAMFKEEWLKRWEIRPETVNVYIMVDPAQSKKKRSDSTAMAVIAVDTAGNRYLVDGFRHKMDLSERWENMRRLRNRWVNMPGVQCVRVGYEKYGMQSDMEYFKIEMDRKRDHFEILELNWTRDGAESKQDRIQRLVPDCKKGRFLLPKCSKEPSRRQRDYQDRNLTHLIGDDIRKLDHEGRAYSLVNAFIQEYKTYPFSAHDDLIDAISRIYDMDVISPIVISDDELEPEFS